MGPREYQRRRSAMTTEWEGMNDHARIQNLHTRLQPIEEMSSVVDKIYRHLKIWGPAIATAAVTSGLVSGRWGAFIHALFSGTTP